MTNERYAEIDTLCVKLHDLPSSKLLTKITTKELIELISTIAYQVVQVKNNAN